MKSFLSIVSISIILFFLVDFFFGNRVLIYLYSFDSIKSPQEIKLNQSKIKENEKKYRIKNLYFHHTLKANVKTKSYWGDIEYNTCTNSQGFRIRCEKKNDKKNSYNIIFLGDSFTEGLGLNYEKTFVGLYEEFSNNAVLNMGVTSYSPIIYLNKIKYFLAQGLKIDSVIVFIDISDIDDEANYYIKCQESIYVCDRNKVIKGANTKKNKVNPINSNFPLANFIKTKTKELKRKIKPKNYIYRENFQRSEWTYSDNFSNYKLGVENSLKYMKLLSNILSKKNINLSVAVYPHPATLLYDKKNSKQVEIWKNFCEARCLNFINFFPTFFDEINNKNEMEVIEKYFIQNDIHFNEEGNKKIFNLLKKYNFGAPNRSRTHNLRSRNPALYPVEAIGAT